MNVIEVVKAHPVPIGLGVLVILLLVMSKGSTSSRAASNAGAYLQSQQMASSANVALAGLNSQTQLGLGAQSVENNRIAADAANTRMGIVGNLFAMTTQANAEVTANRENNLLATYQTSMASKQNILVAENAYDIQKRTIAANVEMNGDKLAAQIRANENDNNTKLSAIGLATSGELALLEKTGSIQSSLADKNYAYQLTTLPMVLQHAETMQKIGGTNAATLANINTEVARINANTNASNAKTARQQSWLGVVGDFLGF